MVYPGILEGSGEGRIVEDKVLIGQARQDENVRNGMVIGDIICQRFGPVENELGDETTASWTVVQ